VLAQSSLPESFSRFTIASSTSRTKTLEAVIWRADPRADVGSEWGLSTPFARTIVPAELNGCQIGEYQIELLGFFNLEPTQKIPKSRY